MEFRLTLLPTSCVAVHDDPPTQAHARRPNLPARTHTTLCGRRHHQPQLQTLALWSVKLYNALHNATTTFRYMPANGQPVKSQTPPRVRYGPGIGCWD